MRINQNISALNAYRNMVNTENRLNKSLERLSSGLRINRAADDAAGLAISEKMRGQIQGLNQAMRNAQDSISLIQTAEGALNETHSILQRMRELSVQAANDTLTAGDRMEIQKELDQLTAEVDRIANTTEFNTKKLLDGTTSALTSTSDLNTKIFMRDGLRVMDQFGQKAVTDGNFRLEIDANPGTGQIQKTDIMKVKHGEEVMEVQDNEPGVAKAFFEDVEISGMSTGDTLTMEFVIDGDQHEVVYEHTSGQDTSDLAEAINDELGHLITAYGDGEGGTLSWVSANLGTDDLLLVLDGGGVIDGTQFDFWVSDNPDNVTLGGDLNETQTTYEAKDTFISSVEVDNPENMLIGDYSIDLEFHSSAAITTSASDGDISDAVFSQYIQKGGVDSLFATSGGTVEAAGDQNLNISLMLEVQEFNYDDSDDVESVVFQYRYVVTDATSGEVVNESEGTRTLLAANDSGAGTINFGGFQFEELSFDSAAATATLDDTMTVGDSMVINAQSLASDDQHEITINRDGDAAVQYAFHASAMDTDDPYTLSFYQLDEDSGEFVKSEVSVNFTEEAWNNSETFGLGANKAELEDAATFTIDASEGIGQVASENTSIHNIDRFWDASGNFLVDDPQTITLVQGDGTKAAFTIFRNDTIADVVDKLNAAIGNEKTNNIGSTEVGKGLGQSDYAPEGEFAYYVPENTESGYNSVAGTIVINSAIAGKDGEINFVGDEDVIKALSLSTIRESSENQFEVTVTNAHTGDVIAEDVSITGNTLVGTVHSNVDVQFNPMANVGVEWNEEDAAFDFVKEDDAAEAFVHLADNTMVFHIGANPLQDIDASIGDMRASALGIDNIQVTDRDSANRAITQVDNAINRVSAERSKMGALQNRLDHTINNLGVAAENLTAAESRIRDLDFAQEMIEFTRNQIMQQAGTSMLAQANMKPQSVLMLLG